MQRATMRGRKTKTRRNTQREQTTKRKEANTASTMMTTTITTTTRTTALKQKPEPAVVPRFMTRMAESERSFSPKDLHFFHVTCPSACSPKKNTNAVCKQRQQN